MRICRRQFIGSCAVGAVSIIAPPRAAGNADDLQAQLETLLGPEAIGVAACAVADGEVCWSGAAGWADIAAERVRTIDTLQNIASISKTVTAAAVMQLVEQNEVDLEADVNAYLPFPVRNPRYADQAITVRHLLTHHGSLRDGPGYGEGYACGDPAVELAPWLRSILDPSVASKPVKPYFIPKAPGDRWAYSNIGYGLLGVVVEEVAGVSFAEYTRDHIFEPLGMTATGWHLKDVDIDQHAKPYIVSGSGDPRNLVTREVPAAGVRELCLYSFPNYPDGLVRTTPLEFARFVMAMMNAGVFEGGRILEEETVERIFSRPIRVSDQMAQGLCWVGHHTAGGTRWGHDGGDPGVATMMLTDRDTRTGALIFINGSGSDGMGGVLRSLLAYAADR